MAPVMVMTLPGLKPYQPNHSRYVPRAVKTVELVSLKLTGCGAWGQGGCVWEGRAAACWRGALTVCNMH